jgi:transcription elongation factor GreA-like protein
MLLKIISISLKKIVQILGLAALPHKQQGEKMNYDRYGDPVTKTENLNIVINQKNISVKHNCYKFFKDQKDGHAELKSYIKERLLLGDKKGFECYNNFECSFHWEIK